MAFTEIEKLRIHQILEIPLQIGSEQVPLKVLEGTMRAATFIAGAFNIATATNLWTYVQANIEGNATLESEVRRIITAYEDVMDVTASVTQSESAQVGQVQGFTWTPEKQKAMLKKNLQVFIPFMREDEFLRKGLADGSRSVSVSTVR